MKHQEPIIALSTPPGSGALAILRLSGAGVIEIVDQFTSRSLTKLKGNELCLTKIMDPDGELLDECVIAVFRAPHSYTAEDVIEINCHGSAYIIQSLLSLFQKAGVRSAERGEFTLRAYLNGKMDLSQAEAVADIIASESRSQHLMAMDQLRGRFSQQIQSLRDRLIHFASLIELENDFSEEDVEFADRVDLQKALDEISTFVKSLKDSFQYGNAIKKGVPVAIIGPPNAGKSTLLNALLQEDKAIVTEIAGTTRDVIEDTIQIDGILFRFIDTAGIRKSVDKVESIGIQRAYEQARKARIILHILPIQEDHKEIKAQLQQIELPENKDRIILLNKIDEFHTCHAYDVEEALSTELGRQAVISLSAETGLHLDKLKEKLVALVRAEGQNLPDVIVTNARHHAALSEAEQHLDAVRRGLLDGLPSDLMALDLRYALSALGEIVGRVQTDDLLDNIFRNFCIGK